MHLKIKCLNKPTAKIIQIVLFLITILLFNRTVYAKTIFDYDLSSEQIIDVARKPSLPRLNDKITIHSTQYTTGISKKSYAPTGEYTIKLTNLGTIGTLKDKELQKTFTMEYNYLINYKTYPVARLDAYDKDNNIISEYSTPGLLYTLNSKKGIYLLVSMYDENETKTSYGYAIFTSKKEADNFRYRGEYTTKLLYNSQLYMLIVSLSLMLIKNVILKYQKKTSLKIIQNNILTYISGLLLIINTIIIIAYPIISETGLHKGLDFFSYSFWLCLFLTLFDLVEKIYKKQKGKRYSIIIFIANIVIPIMIILIKIFIIFQEGLNKI